MRFNKLNFSLNDISKRENVIYKCTKFFSKILIICMKLNIERILPSNRVIKKLFIINYLKN